MAVEFTPVKLAGEVEQWIVETPRSELVVKPTGDHFVGSPLTKESGASWQVSAHPFVTAGDDEVGEFDTFVERNVTECLGRVDKAEPQFTYFFDLTDNLANRQPNAEVVHGGQEQPIALVIEERGGKETRDIARGTFLAKDAFS